MSTYWKKLGRELDVPFNTRDGLSNSNNKDDEDKLEFVEYTWIESNGASATWSALIDALVKIEMISTADEIKRYLGKSLVYYVTKHAFCTFRAPQIISKYRQKRY